MKNQTSGSITFDTRGLTAAITESVVEALTPLLSSPSPDPEPEPRPHPATPDLLPLSQEEAAGVLANSGAPAHLANLLYRNGLVLAHLAVTPASQEMNEVARDWFGSGSDS